jgi:hypothetical protein
MCYNVQRPVLKYEQNLWREKVVIGVQLPISQVCIDDHTVIKRVPYLDPDIAAEASFVQPCVPNSTLIFNQPQMSSLLAHGVMTPVMITTMVIKKVYPLDDDDDDDDEGAVTRNCSLLKADPT